jgi:SAM-dependent methyltransferase
MTPQPSDRSKRREAEIYRGNARLGDVRERVNPLVRLCTDFAFVRRVVRYALGLPVPMQTEDRRVLEQVIFPLILGLPDTQRILFVGCDWYTKHYERAFFRGRDYWTVDISEKARKFAGRNHRVTALEGIDAHFPERRFDVIFCNGVYGFGLDERSCIERALDMCRSRLREGGYFIFGWDDIPARTPVPLESIGAFDRFERFFPAGLDWRYLTDTPYRHTYDFYRRPGP